MIRGFPLGGDTIVTTAAVVHDAGMIEDCAGKRGRVVATAAIFAGGYVIRRLTGSDDTVMASCAATDDARVVEHAIGESAGPVTSTAVQRGRNMVGR